jgi:TPR repeat protein
MTKVRQEVWTETGQDQRPWASSALLGEFYFVPLPEKVPPPAQQAALPPAPARPQVEAPEPPPASDVRDEPDEMARLRKAAEQGDAQAQTNLGWMYMQGQGGLAQNDAEAVRWYRKAAAQGLAAAQTSLGVMYMEGRGGLAQDDAEAARWYRKAAAQGEAWGQGNLGWMYEKGRGGLAQDDAEAVRWYRKAAEQGLIEAKQALTRLGYSG